MRSTRRRIAAAAGAAALAGAAGGDGTWAVLGGSEMIVRELAPAGTSSPIAQVTISSTPVGAIARKASSSVVEITGTSASAATPFRPSGTQQAQGSGFVYDGKGRVITNQHVVDGAESVKVRFWNGASYNAKVMGSDPSTDVAVLEVSAPASLLRPLALGDSSAVGVGDGVVATGRPFGIEGTVTTGIVSALHREITSPNGFAIADAIQTDAAINPDNSGGPLLDMRGRLIGVNSQIESDSGGNDGVGFAVPSNTVKPVAAQLIATGSAEHAYLGVGVETLPASVATKLGASQGVAVATVASGSPVGTAGPQAATGTTTVDGQVYPGGGGVITKLGGTRIEIAVVRGGKTRAVQVTLATRPATAGQ